MITVLPDSSIPSALRRGVVAIGNFDGVHIGHQALLAEARTIAQKHACPFVALTFDPHPRRYFRPDTPPFLLTPPEIKGERLGQAGADGVVIMPFNAATAALSPAAFIADILQTRLDARQIVVGDDFHFGHDRAGSAQTIIDAGIPVTTTPLLNDHTGNPYSSTRVRASLQEGHLDDASHLLGWPWEMRGVVIDGDKRGRTLGYPTANIKLVDTLVPAHGVYAASVQIPGETTWRMAAISLGHRPMFAVHDVLLEVYILDWSGDLYGQTLRVRPAQKLRAEMKFPDLAALVTQIGLDVGRARDILKNHAVMA